MSPSSRVIKKCSLLLLSTTRVIALARCTTTQHAPINMPNDAAPAQAKPNLTLNSAVILSRHGVRSPTRSKPPLTTLSSYPWPQWRVPPGYLSSRGAALIMLSKRGNALSMPQPLTKRSPHGLAPLALMV